MEHSNLGFFGKEVHYLHYLTKVQIRVYKVLGPDQTNGRILVSLIEVPTMLSVCLFVFGFIHSG